MEHKISDESYEQFKVGFCNRIREIRNNKKISAREMSLDLGQNVNYINLIENGKRQPSIQGLFLICEYFHISICDFFEFVQKTTTAQNPLSIFEKFTDTQKNLLLEFLKSVL